MGRRNGNHFNHHILEFKNLTGVNCSNFTLFHECTMKRHFVHLAKPIVNRVIA